MYHTARKAEFQQLFQSVVITADDSHFFKRKLLFRLMRSIPGSTLVCTLHMCSVWSKSVTNTYMHTWCHSLSLWHGGGLQVLLRMIIVLLYTIYFCERHFGISCVPPNSCNKLFANKTFHSFRDARLTYSRNFPGSNFNRAYKVRPFTVREDTSWCTDDLFFLYPTVIN